MSDKYQEMAARWMATVDAEYAESDVTPGTLGEISGKLAALLASVAAEARADALEEATLVCGRYIDSGLVGTFAVAIAERIRALKGKAT